MDNMKIAWYSLFNNLCDRNISIGYYPGFHSLLRDDNWANGELFRIGFEYYKFRVFSKKNNIELIVIQIGVKTLWFKLLVKIMIKTRKLVTMMLRSLGPGRTNVLVYHGTLVILEGHRKKASCRTRPNL